MIEICRKCLQPVDLYPSKKDQQECGVEAHIDLRHENGICVLCWVDKLDEKQLSEIEKQCQ